MTIKQNGGIFGRKPTFSKVDVEGSDASSFDRTGSLGKIVTFNDDGSEVGAIGTNGNVWFQGPSGTAGVEFANGAILPWRDGARANGSIALGSSSYKFNGGHFSNNLVMDSGNGIDFSATSDGSGTTTSELFSDYEEGEWTPELTAASGTFTTVTLGAATGANYTKVGRIVSFQVWFVTDAITAGSAAGDIRISLPFAAATGLTGSSEWVACSVSLALNWGGDYPIAATVRGGEAKMNLVYRTSVNGASSNIQVGDLGTGADDNITTISGTYIAA